MTGEFERFLLEQIGELREENRQGFRDLELEVRGLRAETSAAAAAGGSAAAALNRHLTAHGVGDAGETGWSWWIANPLTILYRGRRTVALLLLLVVVSALPQLWPYLPHLGKLVGP